MNRGSRRYKAKECFLASTARIRNSMLGELGTLSRAVAPDQQLSISTAKSVGALCSEVRGYATGWQCGLVVIDGRVELSISLAPTYVDTRREEGRQRCM